MNICSTYSQQNCLMNLKNAHTKIASAFKSILLILGIFLFSSCDYVNEIPDGCCGNGLAVQVHLQFEGDMIQHEVLVDSRRKVDFSSNYDVRYTLHIYSESESGELLSRIPEEIMVFGYSAITGLDRTLSFRLPRGNWRVMAWADYVEADSLDDKYYNTDDFAEIELLNTKSHQANTDFRDAFRGYGSLVVSGSSSNELTIQMIRPLAKYTFISTDVEDFISQRRNVGGVANVNPEDYSVRIAHTGYMPFSYNMFTDRPADAILGVNYTSPVRLDADGNAVLGFDYLFVGTDETYTSVSLELIDADGVTVANSGAITVPLVRGRHTIVSGKLLTTSTSDGVGINPDFEGEDFNIEIK
jgi:hypothetical protein